jgi:hypothetical protein
MTWSFYVGCNTCIDKASIRHIIDLFDKSTPLYHADTNIGFNVCEHAPSMLSNLTNNGSP